MNASNVFWFLRPTLGVVLCYVAAVVTAYLISNRGVNELDDQISAVNEFAGELGSLHRPSPNLTPKEVVEIQVAAMRDVDRTRGAVQCMLFASPGNLKITGPLPKFARMLRGEKFSTLADSPSLIIGTPVFLDGNARVLVTASSTEGDVNAFVWVLAKQSDDDFDDCWMTDGVFPLANHSDETTDEV